MNEVKLNKNKLWSLEFSRDDSCTKRSPFFTSTAQQCQKSQNPFESKEDNPRSTESKESYLILVELSNIWQKSLKKNFLFEKGPRFSHILIGHNINFDVNNDPITTHTNPLRANKQIDV